jgi:hypothetical protein
MIIRLEHQDDAGEPRGLDSDGYRIQVNLPAREVARYPHHHSRNILTED